MLQRLDLLANQPRFLLAVPDAAQRDLLAFGFFGPQGLAEAPLVMGNEAGSGGEDVRGRAVVALQANHLSARKVALETEDVPDLGAAPAIDRLVIITDAADVAMLAREQPQPQILRDIGVLIFVHQQVSELALIAGENLGLLREECDRVQ